MKILVTGAKGFIGSHLMKLLGEDAISYDLKDDKEMSHDILDYEKLRRVIKENKIEAVVHLAAVSNRQAVDKDPIRAIETNLIGTYNVLKAAKECKVKRVILASSAATAQPELSLYGTTKDCMESFSKMFDNVVVTRFYNVYGPGSKSVVNKFVKLIKQGKEITLYGNTIRDYVYVQDVVDILKLVLDSKSSGRLFEIGTGKSRTLKELVRTIEQVLHKKAKAVKAPALVEIQESRMGKNGIGLYGNISLKEGIKKL